MKAAGRAEGEEGLQAGGGGGERGVKVWARGGRGGGGGRQEGKEMPQPALPSLECQGAGVVPLRPGSPRTGFTSHTQRGHGLGLEFCPGDDPSSPGSHPASGDLRRATRKELCVCSEALDRARIPQLPTTLSGEGGVAGRVLGRHKACCGVPGQLCVWGGGSWGKRCPGQDGGQNQTALLETLQLPVLTTQVTSGRGLPAPLRIYAPVGHPREPRWQGPRVPQAGLSTQPCNPCFQGGELNLLFL